MTLNTIISRLLAHLGFPCAGAINAPHPVNTRRKSCRILIKILLEAREDAADLLGSAEVGNGVGNAVVIFEQEQRPQFLPIQFFDADLHIMGQYESKEDLQLAVEVRADLDLGLRRPPRYRPFAGRQGIATAWNSGAAARSRRITLLWARAEGPLIGLSGRWYDPDDLATGALNVMRRRSDGIFER